LTFDKFTISNLYQLLILRWTNPNTTTFRSTHTILHTNKW